MISNRSAHALVCGLAALYFMSPALAAAAFLEGKVMKVNLLHKTTQTSLDTGDDSGDFTVGPGVELSGFGYREVPFPLPALVDIDISDMKILITLVIDQPFAFQEYFRFIDSNSTIPTPRNVFVNPATNWAGFAQDPIRLSYDGTSINVNVAQLSGLQGQFILLDVIPEPASLGLAAGGLAALTTLRRRR